MPNKTLTVEKFMAEINKLLDRVERNLVQLHEAKEEARALLMQFEESLKHRNRE